MGVMVRFGRQIAFLRRGEWVSANPGLEEKLNRLTRSWIQQTGGPPVNDRNHERTVARELAARLGGRVVRGIRPATKKTAGDYISLRQLSLGF